MRDKIFHINPNPTMRIITEIIALNAHVPLLDTRDFDDCIIGYCRKSNRFVYSASKMINRLQDKMPEHEAIHYYHTNFEKNNEKAIWCYDYFQ